MRLTVLFTAALLGSALAPAASAQQAERKGKVDAFTIKQGIAKLQELIDQPAPAGLPPADAAQYQAQTDWLKSVRLRFTGLVTPSRDAATGAATGRQADPAARLGELQQAVAGEAKRRFQTLSNASKARHEMAMSIIANIRA